MTSTSSRTVRRDITKSLRPGELIFFRAANDPMIIYLAVNTDPAALTQLRSFDTHGPTQLKPGNDGIRRQRG